MHIGIACLEMTGHLNPSMTLGRELARRGHRVTFLTSPRVRERVERAGFGFAPVGEREEAENLTTAALERLGSMTGLAAGMFTIRMLRIVQEVLLRDLPAAVRRVGVEGLVVDQGWPAAAVVAEEAGLPYVVICNALAMCHDESVPPPPLLWRHREGFVWRLRNRLGSTFLRPLADRLMGLPRGGVSPLMLMLEPWRGLACVSQQPAFFDFPRSALPDHFHYTGPWHEPARDDDVPFPWERLDGRPLVYASLGTIQNRLRHVYAAIAEAVRGMDVQAVIALGSPTATLDMTPPENVIVVPYAPQLRLLERAAVAVTHAGLNTALECLSQGVPMLCLPVTNDQPGVALRVEWVGAGELLPVRRANAARVRGLLTKVLGEGRYREAAGRWREEIARVDGAGRAADVIERALMGGERVARDGAGARATESFNS